MLEERHSASDDHACRAFASAITLARRCFDTIRAALILHCLRACLTLRVGSAEFSHWHEWRVIVIDASQHEEVVGDARHALERSEEQGSGGAAAMASGRGMGRSRGRVGRGGGRERGQFGRRRGGDGREVQHARFLHSDASSVRRHRGNGRGRIGVSLQRMRRRHGRGDARRIDRRCGRLIYATHLSATSVLRSACSCDDWASATRGLAMTQQGGTAQQRRQSRKSQRSIFLFSQ